MKFFPHIWKISRRVSFFGDKVESIDEFDPFLGTITKSLDEIIIFANSHYVTPKPSLKKAIDQIREELKDRISF